MEYYSVPSDFSKKTIDGYQKLNEAYPECKVKETYGQISIGNAFASGGYLSEIPKISFSDLKEYVRYSKGAGIDFNYTFNASYMNNTEFTEEGMNQLKDFLRQLYDIGIRSLTVALPTLYEIIRSMNLDFEVKASVICQINNANKAAIYKEKGYDRIVVDEGINRDFNTLERIRSNFGDGVELIINSLCSQDCVYRMFHYNQTSGDAYGRPGFSFYNKRCTLNLFKDYRNLMHLSWIRPEDLKYYREIGINHYKLQGREYVTHGDPIKTVEIYFKKSYEGNLMELLDMFSTNFNFKFYVENRKLDGFIDGLYHNRYLCKKDCNSCDYCAGYADASVNVDTCRQISEIMNKEFANYDKFCQMINTK